MKKKKTAHPKKPKIPKTLPAPPVAVRAKGWSHEIPSHLRPAAPAHSFKSVYRRRAQVAEYLFRVFSHPTLIHVDFDLATACFLQQTHHLHLGDIPICVDRILADYSLLLPLTARQDSLLVCAREIKASLVLYSQHPSSNKPFALRYLNLNALNKLATERSMSPEIVGQGRAVVFIDLAGRAVACGIPPKESLLATTLSGQVRWALCNKSQSISHLVLFS